MKIAELPDRNIDFYDGEVLKNEPLLEYVWEVALEFVPDPSDISSLAPNIFNKRYAISKLSGEERTARIFNGELFWLEGKSKEEFSANYKNLDTSFKEEYLNYGDLQNTIEAFGLDKNKFWYLLLFVYDYVEDCANNAIDHYPIVDKLNEALQTFKESTEIVFKKDNRKSGEIKEDNVLKIFKIGMEHFVKSYNSIMDNQATTLQEKLQQLDALGLKSPLEPPFVNYEDVGGDYKKIKIEISHKKCLFTEIFLFFLKDRKAKTLPQHIKYKVSKDKMLFISRLLYTVGYADEDYKEDYDSEGNKTRKLSNLLRRYKDFQFPPISSKRIYRH